MPLTLTFTEGALPKGSEKEAGKWITEAFQKWHGLPGNKVMTPNVTNQIHILSRDGALSGGNPVIGAWFETKTPSFALSSREVQEGSLNEATDIIEKLSGGKLSRDHIYANAVQRWMAPGTWMAARSRMSNWAKPYPRAEPENYENSQF